MGALMGMTPFNLSEEDMRQAEEEFQKIESMTDAELQVYYSTDPDGISEMASMQKEAEESEEWERTPIEKRRSPLGRKLIRPGLLELYQQIYDRVAKGVPRKVIASELGISEHRLKMALRNLRRLTGQDPKSLGKSHVHKGDEYKRCPQCRGYENQDVRSEYDSNPRRRHKKKEIPVSRMNLPGEHDENLDWLSDPDRQDGNRRKYKPPS